MEPVKRSVFLYQLATMLYRGLITRKRHWIVTTAQILGPFLVILLILEINHRPPSDKRVTTTTMTPEEDDSQPETNLRRDVTNISTAEDYEQWHLENLKPQNFYNTLYGYPLYYTVENKEDTAIVNQFLASVDENLPKREGKKPLTFTLKNSTDSLYDFFTFQVVNNSSYAPLGLIEFGNVSGLKGGKSIGRFDYRLHILVPHDKYWPPDQFILRDTGKDIQYLVHTIPILQMLINNEYLKEHNALNYYPFEIGFFDHEKVRIASTFETPKEILMLIPILLIIPFSITVYRIQNEKETRLREIFTMSGLSCSVYWLSVLINNFIDLFITLLLINIVFSIVAPYRLPESSPLANMTFFPLFFVFNLHALHSVLSAMLLSIPINRPIIGTAFSMLIYVIPIIISSLDLTRNQMSPLYLLLPNGGLVKIFDCIVDVSGMPWKEFIRFKDRQDDSRLFIGSICMYMFFGCIFYWILIWYLDNVWPFQPGVPKSAFFFLTEHYLFPGYSPRTLAPIRSNPAVFSEPVPSNIPTAISIRNVSKIFSNFLTGYSFVAVDEISVDIHHGMITCLLGHNGAGKTTLMNMITGMYPPTDGQIYINGFDLLYETEAARRGMSFCPQYNAFDDKFSIEENLFVFAGIKGVPFHLIHKEVLKIIHLLSLTDHMGVASKFLSGGMKRRLCVGIALIGDSKILILDEPTSGLDIDARHELWVLLKLLRRSRTILMTTHDMEEADALADRVIIMDAGVIMCSGSTMFLRKCLCTGYILRIYRDHTFDSHAFLSLLRENFLPDASIRDDTGVDITYNLNQFSTQLLPMSELFAFLEDNLEALGIKTFGVSSSSLEEVFFKIGDKNIADALMARSQGLSEYDPSKVEHMRALVASGVYQYRLSGYHLIVKQLQTLMRKRFYSLRRQWLPICISMIFSLLFYSFVCTSRNTMRRVPNLGPFYLARNRYPRARVALQLDKNKELRDKVKSIAGFRQYVIEEYTDLDDMKAKVKKEMEEYGDAPFLFAFKLEDHKRFTIYINIEMPHSLTYALDTLYNSLLSFSSDGKPIVPSGIGASFQLTTSIDSVKYKELIRGVTWASLEGFGVIVSYAFFSSVFIIFPIQESVSKSKLLQMMTGINAGIFHLANFAFDLIIHIVFSIILLCLSYALTGEQFSGYGTETFFTFILFGFSCLTLIYLSSSLFKSPLQGYTAAVVFQLSTTLISGILAFLIKSFSKAVIVASPFFTLTDIAFHLNPFYTMMNALGKIIFNSRRNELCDPLSLDQKTSSCANQFLNTTSIAMKQETVDNQCCPDICVTDDDGGTICAERFSAFSPNGLWIQWLVLLGQFILISTLLILYEQGYWAKFYTLLNFIFGTPDLVKKFSDRDVAAEEDLVLTLPHDEDKPLVTIKLYKTYELLRKHFAVKGISFHVRPKECFGFFGVNGAGKSTTFGMITGDIRPTSGEVWHGPFEISQNTPKCQRQIGFCPQYNPLIDQLTGREMIWLFASLRGVPEDALTALAQEMISLVGLVEYADKVCGDYSTGNKRRLSIALAVIGNPEVVLLDEPTAGVDPLGRRVIWTTLMQIKEQYNCSIILTSHSMEECEALCSRMTIMVKGELVCIGSPQHLKERFGQGYTLHVRFDMTKCGDAEYIKAFTEALIQQFVKIRVIDSCDANITFKIDKQAGTWSSLFASMDRIKETFALQDYQLTDTTLEQIFSKLHRLK